MLDQIKIASPCSADWEQMEGTDRVRFCGECKKNVFNLSAMTRRDAEALVKETNGNLCARVYRRADGTVLTEDCPVGFSVKIGRVQRRVGWAVAGALSFATAFGQDPAAALSGKIADASGASIPSAKITVIDQTSGKSSESKADQAGNFKIESLEPGTYTVRVAVPGFKEFHHMDTAVTASHETKLEITMQIGGITMGGPIAAAVTPKRWWHHK